MDTCKDPKKQIKRWLPRIFRTTKRTTIRSKSKKNISEFCGRTDLQLFTEVLKNFVPFSFRVNCSYLHCDNLNRERITASNIGKILSSGRQKVDAIRQKPISEKSQKLAKSDWRPIDYIHSSFRHYNTRNLLEINRSTCFSNCLSSENYGTLHLWNVAYSWHFNAGTFQRHFFQTIIYTERPHTRIKSKIKQGGVMIAIQLRMNHSVISTKCTNTDHCVLLLSSAITSILLCCIHNTPLLNSY